VGSGGGSSGGGRRGASGSRRMGTGNAPRRNNPWRRRGHERKAWQQAQRGTPRAGRQSSTNGGYAYGARLSRQRRQRPQKKAAERMASKKRRPSAC